jgi:hypothetical protein
MRLEENFENFLNEDNSDFKQGIKIDELKRRHEMNLKRYRAAQERGSNYHIKLYELRLKLDNHDFEKMKIRSAIKNLKKKHDKLSAPTKDTNDGE